MALRDEILATYQKITLDVLIAGQRVNNVLECTVTMGYDQVNATATIVCATRPGQAVELASVEVWAGYNGLMAQIFWGECSGVTWEHFPTGIALDCRDLYARTRYGWGAVDRTYTSQDDAAIIQNLVEAYGIPVNKTSIQSSNWTLGIIQDVVLETGRDGAALIAEIDDLAGYKTATTSDGVVRRRRVSGNPAATAFWTFQEGVDILHIRRIRTEDRIANRAVIDGYEYEGVAVSGTASATNSYLPNPPGTVTYQQQSNLVETDAVAGTIAARIVGDRNRRPEKLEIEAIGNPLIQPFMTVGLVHADLEVSSARVFVEHVEHRITQSSFTTTITTSGGNLSGYDASAANTNPVALLDVKLFREGQDSGGTVSAFYVGIADGGQSYDPDGTAVSYAWSATATGGTVTSYGGTTGPQYRFAASGTPTAISVSLIVTDGGGATGTASWAGTIAASQILVEDLYTAEGTIVAASNDGQQTWGLATIAGGSATCLSAFGPSWGNAWGASNGVVYRTEEMLASGTLISCGTVHATAVTAICVHETEQERIWAGAASGRVAFSSDRGTTWSLRGTAGGQINELRESYGALDTLYVTAGTLYQVSFDGGRTFVTYGTAAGGTAWRMAAGWNTNWWSTLGTAPYIRNESGGSVAFAGGTPTGIRGLSPGWRTPELYAADDAGSAKLYVTGSDFATATVAGTAPTQINHMIRSGNEDGVVYLAGNNGAYKSVRMQGAPTKIRDTGSRVVHMVGYGDAHVPLAIATILMLPSGASGAADKLWILDGRTGLWTGKALPAASKSDWQSLRANRFNPAKLLLFRYTGTGDNALYESENFGDSWSTVFTNLATSNDATGKIAGWSLSSGTDWVLSRTNSGTRYVQRGVGASYSEVTISPSGAGEVFVGAGLTGDVLVLDVNGTLYYLNSANVLSSGVASGLGFGLFDTIAGTTKACHARTASEYTVGVTSDYRAGSWSQVGSTAARSYAQALANETIVCGGRLTASSWGIQEIANAWSSPSASVVAFSGIAIGAVATDRQTQTLAAAVYHGDSTTLCQPAVRRTTGQWVLLSRPPSATTLANRIEVIGT